MAREFTVTVAQTVTVTLEDAVIDAVSDEWRSVFYDLRTPEDIAEHIAYNAIVNRLPLSALDGWADQPGENATVDVDYITARIEDEDD